MHSLFRRQVVNHKKNKLVGEVILSQPPSLIMFGFFCIFLFVSLVFFVCNYSYPNYVSATGEIEIRGVIELRMPQSGIIDELYVSEGENVKKFQKLLNISKAEVLSNGLSSFEAIKKEYFKKKEIIINNSDLSKKNFEAEQNKYKLKIKHIDSEIKLVNEIYKKQINKKEKLKNQLYKFKFLEKDTFVSNTEVENKEFNIVDIEIIEAELKLQIEKLRGKKSDYQEILKQLKLDSKREENLITTSLSNLEIDYINKETSNTFNLVSPMDGVVSGVQNKEGQSVVINTSLMSIIPANGEWKAKVFIPSRIIGLVKQRQKIRLMLDSFPYQKYGGIEGEIESLSKTTIMNKNGESYYIGYALLERNYMNIDGTLITLKNGMKFNIDIILDERKIVEWVFEPIIKIIKRHG